MPPTEKPAKKPTKPRDCARRGLYTVVAQLRGRWRAVATPTDRAGAVAIFRATPGAHLYGPDRLAVQLSAAELTAPVYAVPPPTEANARAAERTPAPKPPRLTDGLTVRMTTEMREQIAAAAVDGSRWPGGFAVDPAEVVREALRRYFAAQG